MLRQQLRMKRAISETDEQAVRDYYNRTADSLGIARPLSPDDWFQIKAQLRARVEEGLPPEWSPEVVQLHTMACADLAIDPLPERMGPVPVFFAWIFSPADRHGRLSEAMRIAVLLSISWAMSWGLVSISNSFFGMPASGLETIQLGSLFALAIGGIFISSDTMVGAFGLQIAILLGISLLSAQADLHWAQMVAKILGMIFGGFMFIVAIR